MPIINLKRRGTQDNRLISVDDKSPESHVCICPYKEEKISPVAVDVTVGEEYILPGDSRTYEITDRGIRIKPECSVIIRTAERICLPLNVFGIVTGKGSNIFKGCFISTGKIDPGFQGNLRIGVFNGGRENIIFKHGQALCSLYFVDTQNALEVAPTSTPTSPSPNRTKEKWYRQFLFWLRNNWYSTLALILTIIGLIIQYLKK
jgi:dCTP deaminase